MPSNPVAAAHQHDERSEQGNEQYNRAPADCACSPQVPHAAQDHKGHRPQSGAAAGGPCGKQPPEIEDGQRGIDGHVEDAGSQREPRLLVTPEGAEGSPHPDIEAALGGDGAGQLADHEGRGQAPHERNDGEDQQRAQVPRAAERVLDAIGATGDHKEGRGDQREKAQPSAFVQRVRWI